MKNSLTRTSFILSCLEQGYSVKLNKKSEIVASKTIEQGYSLRLVLSSGNSTVTVYEYGQETCAVPFAEFEVHA